MKILLIGSAGMLGTELKKLIPDIIPLTRSDLDITEKEKCFFKISGYKPDIVINLAAKTDNREIEKNPTEALSTNIIGAANVAIACHLIGCRYIYVSTDYVYKGDRGNYKEEDEILPFNLYSWTKLGGECSAKAVKNHLIIRTSFGGETFYKQAFIDKWSSKDYVNVIAPMILEAALSPLTGVLNLGTDRKTLFDYAVKKNPEVEPIKLSETHFFTPYDTSMNLQKWIDYKSSNPVAKTHSNCRVCGSDKLVKYLDLALMPLPNNLHYSSLLAKDAERFPLQVMFCEDCGLSQLSVIINPSKMFSNYTYRSSINGGYKKHCRQMAKDLRDKFGITKESFHIDIAGNDGALLLEFKEEIGLNVLNVDPASNLAAIAEAQGIPTVNNFWDTSVALNIINNNGKADLITATNVFAHVDNVTDFIAAAKETLADNGVLVIECPYLIDFIENMEFDTVYFEHLSYISIIPVNQLCNELGMKLIEVSKHPIHGGTVRMTIAKNGSKHKVTESVRDFINKEVSKGFHKIDAYKNWSDQINELTTNFGLEILKLKKEGYKIGAYAASAKGNTLLNSVGINTDLIDYIVDQTPEKIGKFSPGTGIPIVHESELINKPVDYLVILSWNFSNEIMEKAKKAGFKGKFIIPIPEFTVIE